VSDTEILDKQKRQHTVGAVGQLLTAKIVEKQKSVTSSHAAIAAQENVALRNLEAQEAQTRVKWEAAVEQLGFIKQGDSWKPKTQPKTQEQWTAMQADYAEACQKWTKIQEAFAAKAKAISAELMAKAKVAERTASALDTGFYGEGWQDLAQQLDSWVNQKMKATKRRFNNIVSVKSVDRKKYTEQPFAAVMVQDLDFGPGTCVLISAGLKKGSGEAGGSIGSHAIAAHFKSTKEIYLFDPNLGIFECTSKEQFRRTLETMLDNVYPNDFKWKLDQEFGYALFRARGETQANVSERTLRHYASADFTATTAKADGITPRGGVKGSQ
jgi:virulence surface antigen